MRQDLRYNIGKNKESGMFGFLKNIFSSKEKKEKNIISILKDDHKRLIDIYVKIDKAMDKNDFVLAQHEVANFVREYNKHILLEDTQLYVALEEKYQDKKHILKTIKAISKDMNAITRAITFFERKYKEINYNNRDIFMEEFKHIGSVLTQRVELEEERLYPLL